MKQAMVKRLLNDFSSFNQRIFRFFPKLLQIQPEYPLAGIGHNTSIGQKIKNAHRPEKSRHC
jgi:hypothetical protein